MGFTGFDFSNASEIYAEHAALTQEPILISVANYDI
jgi:hypothetical protein